MPSIIKHGGSGDTLIWKHPAKTVTTGSLLMVKSPYDVIITQYDVPVALYTTGSAATINARDLSRPCSDSELNEDYETDCNVYFINKAYTFELHWRTDNEYTCYFRGDSFYEASAFGSIHLQVTNTARFAYGVYNNNLPFSSEKEISKTIEKTFAKHDAIYLARLFSTIIGKETFNMTSIEKDDAAYRDALAIKLIKNLAEDKLAVCCEFGLSIVDVTVDHIAAISRDNLRDNKYYDDYCAILERENGKIPAHIVEEVESIIAKEFPPEKSSMGMCHAIWHRTKELYAERGYTWYSPQDLHPACMFD